MTSLLTQTLNTYFWYFAFALVVGCASYGCINFLEEEKIAFRFALAFVSIPLTLFLSFIETKNLFYSSIILFFVGWGAYADKAKERRGEIYLLHFWKIFCATCLSYFIGCLPGAFAFIDPPSYSVPASEITLIGEKIYKAILLLSPIAFTTTLFIYSRLKLRPGIDTHFPKEK